MTSVLANETLVTAFRFDRLPTELRPFARGAALAYVQTLRPPGDFAQMIRDGNRRQYVSGFLASRHGF